MVVPLLLALDQFINLIDGAIQRIQKDQFFVDMIYLIVKCILMYIVFFLWKVSQNHMFICLFCIIEVFRIDDLYLEGLDDQFFDVVVKGIVERVIQGYFKSFGQEGIIDYIIYQLYVTHFCLIFQISPDFYHKIQYSIDVNDTLPSSFMIILLIVALNVLKDRIFYDLAYFFELLFAQMKDFVMFYRLIFIKVIRYRILPVNQSYAESNVRLSHDISIIFQQLFYPFQAI